MLRSLDQLDFIRLPLYALRRWWLQRRYGVVTHPSTRISLQARIVSGGPGSIVVGQHSVIAFKTLLLARDGAGRVRPIRIGARCLIGGGATILPGVTIGDGCVIGAGAVVYDDIPAGCIAVGSPAHIVRRGIETERFGRLKGIDGNEGQDPHAA